MTSVTVRFSTALWSWKYENISIDIFWFLCTTSKRNGYRRRKYIRCPEFKSWTKLWVFHFAQIIFGKAWIHLFFQLRKNSREG